MPAIPYLAFTEWIRVRRGKFLEIFWTAHQTLLKENLYIVITDERLT